MGYAADCAEARKLVASPHWIEWHITATVAGRSYEHTARTFFAEAPVLFDERKVNTFEDSLYVHARRRAAANARRAWGLHSCTSLKRISVEPHDWSDTVDAASEAFHDGTLLAA